MFFVVLLGSRSLTHYTFLRGNFTASHDVLPLVDWLIGGSKLPGRVVPDYPIDLRLWLSDSGEIFWLAAKFEATDREWN